MLTGYLRTLIPYFIELFQFLILKCDTLLGEINCESLTIRPIQSFFSRSLINFFFALNTDAPIHLNATATDRSSEVDSTDGVVKELG